MKNYNYRITKQVYHWIVDGTKRIELRLFNEKSSKINIGDYITFKVINEENPTIKVQVKSLLRYQNVEDILKDFDIDQIADKSSSQKQIIESMNQIFGKEKVEAHEILGIKFEIIQEEDLLISKSIDKDPYVKDITADKIINLTGESGSGKSTYCQKHFSSSDYIVVDTDLIFREKFPGQGVEKYLRKMFQEEYLYLANYRDCIIERFDEVYLKILDYFKNSKKTIVIDSAQFRNIKDISILKGQVIVMRTSIDTCYHRCLNRFLLKNPSASPEEQKEYAIRKKNIYIWYHSLNEFLIKIIH